MSKTRKSVDAISVKSRNLKLKRKWYWCGGDHQKGKGRCLAKAAECHECGKHGHFANVCLNASSVTSPRSSQRKQSHDHQAKNYHYKHQHHNYNRSHRTNTKHYGKHHRSKKVHEIQESSSFENDFSDKCSTCSSIDSKDERYLVDKLTFVIEPIQVNQVTCGSKVYVDLQVPKPATYFKAKLDNGVQANIMPCLSLCMISCLGPGDINHLLPDCWAMAVSYYTIMEWPPWCVKLPHLSPRSWISTSPEKAAWLSSV